MRGYIVEIGRRSGIVEVGVRRRLLVVGRGRFSHIKASLGPSVNAWDASDRCTTSNTGLTLDRADAGTVLLIRTVEGRCDRRWWKDRSVTRSGIVRVGVRDVGVRDVGVSKAGVRGGEVSKVERKAVVRGVGVSKVGVSKVAEIVGKRLLDVERGHFGVILVLDTCARAGINNIKVSRGQFALNAWDASDRCAT